MSAAQIDFTAVRGYTELGDEVLAALVDTTAETLGVDETTDLISTGDFSSDSNWTENLNGSSGGSTTIGSGILTITQGSNSVWMGRFQAITTVVGQHYEITADLLSGHSQLSRVGAKSTSGVPSGGNFDLGYMDGLVSGQKFVFKATTTTTYIWCLSGQAATQSSTFDNVIVKATGNLVSNGRFYVDNASYWSDVSTGTGTATIGSGVLTLSSGASWETDRGVLQQSLSLELNKTYVLKITNSSAQVGRVFISSSVAATNIPANDTTSFTFIAGTASPVLALYSPQTDSVSCTLDNISIRLAEPDASSNADGLEIHGQITKAAVDTGADLMSYSGYSTDNYLLQPVHAGNFSISTNNWGFILWVKSLTVSTALVVFELGYFDGSSYSTSGGGHIRLEFDSSGNLHLRVTDDGYVTEDTVGGTNNFDDDTWHFVNCFRNGSTFYLYVDNVLVDSTAVSAAAGSLTPSSTGGGLYVGTSAGFDKFTNGEISLFRFYTDYPSITEITTLYNNEKHLFDRYAYYTKEGNQYTLSNVFSEKDRDNNVIKSSNISIGGVVESLVDRFEIFHNVTSGLLHYATDLPQWREFLYCVQGDETFTYTPGGGYEPNTAVVCSLESKSHSERRVSSSIYHRISLKLRDRSDG